MGDIHVEKFFAVVESVCPKEFASLVMKANERGYVLVSDNAFQFTGERFVAFYMVPPMGGSADTSEFLVIDEDSAKGFAERLVEVEEGGFLPVAGQHIFTGEGRYVALYSRNDESKDDDENPDPREAESSDVSDNSSVGISQAQESVEIPSEEGYDVYRSYS